jgi:hypothetical protein
MLRALLGISTVRFADELNDYDLQNVTEASHLKGKKIKWWQKRSIKRSETWSKISER